MGRLLGLTNRSIKLMVGDKDNRKWSIRGFDKQGGPKTQLFDESLEMAYMRYNNKRRIWQAKLECSVRNYNRFKKALNDQRMSVAPYCVQVDRSKWAERLQHDELDESYVDEIHNEYLKKRLLFDGLKP